ncbi:MAG: creatininase family protein [Streptosporangiaceae bacterium]
MSEHTGARRVALAEMTSPEAGEALSRARVALVPVGATEQHGPNMTLQTDSAVAYELAVRTAAAMHPRAVVAPTVPYGVSYHHMAFPGTMTLSPETFQSVVREVVESLHRHGVERFLIVDGHGGNQGALDVLMTTLRFRLGVRAAYLFYFTLVDDLIHERVRSPWWGHACEVEASIGLALRPDLVRREALRAGAVRGSSLPHTNPNASPRLGFPLAFDDITDNGALGDARLADPDFGAALAGAAVERTVEFLERFIDEG